MDVEQMLQFWTSRTKLLKVLECFTYGTNITYTQSTNGSHLFCCCIWRHSGHRVRFVLEDTPWPEIFCSHSSQLLPSLFLGTWVFEDKGQFVATFALLDRDGWTLPLALSAAHLNSTGTFDPYVYEELHIQLRYCRINPLKTERVCFI